MVKIENKLKLSSILTKFRSLSSKIDKYSWLSTPIELYSRDLNFFRMLNNFHQFFNFVDSLKRKFVCIIIVSNNARGKEKPSFFGRENINFFQSIFSFFFFFIFCFVFFSSFIKYNTCRSIRNVKN